MNRSWGLAFGFTFLAFLFRCIWIADMEWKGDEVEFFNHYLNIGNHPWSPLGLKAWHSGVTQSSLFFYTLKVVSLGATSPEGVALGIAAFNAFAIGTGLFLTRRVPWAFAAFALAAVHPTLVIHSRKIWTPDLLVAWTSLTLAFWIFAQHAPSARARGWALWGSGFLSAWAGHMYSPGLAYGGLFVIGASLALLLHAREEQRGSVSAGQRSTQAGLSRAWVAGVALGWASWIPYAVALLSRPSVVIESTGGLVQSSKYELTWATIWSVLKALHRLPSPYDLTRLYLPSGTLEALKPLAPTGLIGVSWGLLSALGWIMTGLFLWGGLRALRAAFGRGAQPGAVVTGIASGKVRDVVGPALWVVFGTGAAVLTMRLGSHLHYWLGAIPYALALLCLGLATHRHALRIWVVTVILLALSSASLLTLIHVADGMPGEYGSAFRTKKGSDPF